MKVRYLDRDSVVAALRRIAGRLGAERAEILEVRLFGSLARRERNPHADADLLIVLESSDVPFRDRLPLYKPTGSPVPMDLTVCTRAELGREIANGNRFIGRVLAESEVLYARDRDDSRRPSSRPASDEQPRAGSGRRG